MGSLFIFPMLFKCKKDHNINTIFEEERERELRKEVGKWEIWVITELNLEEEEDDDHKSYSDREQSVTQI